MGDENPGGVPEQLVVEDHGETNEDAGSEADIKGEDVDVVIGAPALPISGFELQGFIFSETIPWKGLDGQILSEGVVNTDRQPQCEFSNFHSSLAFGLMEYYGAHSNFPSASNQRAPLHEEDFVRLLCFSV